MTSFDIKRLALILAIQAEIEGYKAFNAMRDAEGYSVYYNEEVFFEKAEELRELSSKHDDQL